MLNNLLSKLFSVQTVEHKPEYKCKGLCHSDMRCIDLPGHEKVCTSDILVLPEETRQFLTQEVKKVFDEEWQKHVNLLLDTKKEDLDKKTVRQCC